MIKPIKRSIDLRASAARVWEVLLQDEYYRKWTTAFSEGSYAETDWKLGSTVVFTDKKRYGLIGTIIENIPNEVIAMKYSGQLVDGKEDYDSENAKKFIGNIERYTLSENNGVTTLNIYCDMDAEYYTMMNGMWDTALINIKRLSEAKE